MNLIEANRKAQDLLYAHGLAQTGWSVGWNNNRSRAGVCKYNKRTVEFSRLVFRVLSDEEIMNTITHEVAHALTPGHKHDHVWAATHRRLGGDGRRSISDVEVTYAVVKHTAYCRVSNERVAGVNRMTQRLLSAVCKCHNTPVRWVSR